MGTLLVVGLFLMIVGYTMTFIGIALYENRIRNPTIPWWVYAITITGASLAVIGSTITVFRFGSDSNNTA